MVEIVKAVYRRTIIPDNNNPGKIVKTYEAEQFEFEAIANKKGETVSDLIDFCEREVLHQHKRLQAIRDVRNDSEHIERELNEISTKLIEHEKNSDKSLYNKDRLVKRKDELMALLNSVK